MKLIQKGYRTLTGMAAAFIFAAYAFRLTNQLLSIILLVLFFLSLVGMLIVYLDGPCKSSNGISGYWKYENNDLHPIKEKKSDVINYVVFFSIWIVWMAFIFVIAI